MSLLSLLRMAFSCPICQPKPRSQPHLRLPNRLKPPRLRQLHLRLRLPRRRRRRPPVVVRTSRRLPSTTALRRTAPAARIGALVMTIACRSVWLHMVAHHPPTGHRQRPTLLAVSARVRPTPSSSLPLRVSFAMSPSPSMPPSVIPSSSCGEPTTILSPGPLLSFPATGLQSLHSLLAGKTRTSSSPRL